MQKALEVALALLDFHRAFLVVIDRAIFTLGPAERNHLLDDFGNAIGIRPDRSRARYATERPHAALDGLNLFSWAKLIVRINQNDRAVAHDRLAFFCKIKRHNRDILDVDVEPDVEFRPVGERKNADALAFVDL